MKTAKVGIPAHKSLVRKAGRIMLILLSILTACMFVLMGVLFAISPGTVKPFLDGNGKKLTGSISEKITVTIGGVKQGMFLRGRDARNPVLLFLHGGPGMPEFFLAESRAAGLEDAFTICYWEQRGAGISYSPGMLAEDVTTDQLISDTIEVTNYLRNRFGQDRIYLMAHSWGTYLSIQVAAKAPELYHAYIGMAQIADLKESERLAYAYMLEQYAAAGNTGMVEKLEEYPVLDSDAALRSFFPTMLRDDAMHRIGIGTTRDMKSVVTGIFLPIMGSRAYTLGEKLNIWRAKAFLRSKTVLLDELFATDLADTVPRLTIPAYFISGSHDYTVNYGLSKDYLSHLQAPAKGFYTFGQSAHSPMFEEPDRFLRIMTEDVLNGTTALADSD